MPDPILIKLALAQWKIQAQFGAPLCIGGCMHITSVTPAGAGQWLAGVYPDYAEHAARFGDPNADEVAETLDQRAAA